MNVDAKSAFEKIINKMQLFSGKSNLTWEERVLKIVFEIQTKVFVFVFKYNCYFEYLYLYLYLKKF